MMTYSNIGIPWPGWQIVSELGEGGYGKVYKIERTQSGITESAALKVISIPKSKSEYDTVLFSLHTAEAVESFFAEKKDGVLDEIRTMQSLKGCANIVYIDDWTVIEKEDGPGWDIFIRMELLRPLQSVFSTKAATEEDVIELGKDICTALERCEKKDFIHRDIKPGNILVGQDGDYKLADFGIARTLDHTTYVTRAGTPPYMSPEIYNGETADRTVDLYSLGLVMYELLNDRRLPFVPNKYSPLEAQAAVTRRMNGEAIPAPANGSAALKKVILKACAYDPKDRFRSAKEMRNALEKAAQGESTIPISTPFGRKRKKPAIKIPKPAATENAWGDDSKTVAAEDSPVVYKSDKTQATQIASDDKTTEDHETKSGSKQTPPKRGYSVTGSEPKQAPQIDGFGCLPFASWFVLVMVGWAYAAAEEITTLGFLIVAGVPLVSSVIVGLKVKSNKGRAIYEAIIVIFMIVAAAYIWTSVSSGVEPAEEIETVDYSGYTTYSYCGIEFSLPDTWESSKSGRRYQVTNDTFRKWSPDYDGNDVSFSVQLFDDQNSGNNGEYDAYDTYKEGGLQALDNIMPWLEGNRGTIEVDDVEGYYIEIEGSFEGMIPYLQYLLYIPVQSGEALVEAEFYYDLGFLDSDGVLNENEYLEENKTIREKVLNSITIE